MQQYVIHLSAESFGFLLRRGTRVALQYACIFIFIYVYVYMYMCMYMPMHISLFDAGILTLYTLGFL